jgi:hypothetical protein
MSILISKPWSLNPESEILKPGSVNVRILTQDNEENIVRVGEGGIGEGLRNGTKTSVANGARPVDECQTKMEGARQTQARLGLATTSAAALSASHIGTMNGTTPPKAEEDDSGNAMYTQHPQQMLGIDSSLGKDGQITDVQTLGSTGEDMPVPDTVVTETLGVPCQRTSEVARVSSNRHNFFMASRACSSVSAELTFCDVLTSPPMPRRIPHPHTPDGMPDSDCEACPRTSDGKPESVCEDVFIVHAVPSGGAGGLQIMCDETTQRPRPTTAPDHHDHGDTTRLHCEHD